MKRGVLAFAASSRGARSLRSLVLCAALLGGCASEIPMRPAELVSAPDATATFVLAENVPVVFSTGYRRTLKGGTRWQRVGTLPEGDVYDPLDSVFTVEGRHIREAYLVVHEGKLVGFFLPVEDAFVPLPDAVPLHTSN